jgi:hypothetical protein
MNAAVFAALRPARDEHRWGTVKRDRDRGAFLRFYLSFVVISGFLAASGGSRAIIGGCDFLFSLLKVIKSYYFFRGTTDHGPEVRGAGSAAKRGQRAKVCQNGTHWPITRRYQKWADTQKGP